MKTSKAPSGPIREVALYFNPGLLEDGLKVTGALTLVGLNVVRVEPNQGGQTVGFLAGLRGFTQEETRTPPLPQELGILVFSGISGQRLDEVLIALRQAGLSRPILKSILTMINREWTFAKLCGELTQEREAIRRARKM